MTIAPSHFVQAMRQRWAQEYGLKSGKPLEQAWHEMAVTFNDHIRGVTANQWSILRLPTGSGKTQGLALYCSLLSEQEDHHPGVLVITKFTDEVDNLVNTINQAPYVRTALAEHGKFKPEERPTPEEMHSSPVLAITHSMYKQALEANSHSADANTSWGKFTEWKRGTRKLIVIDEALDVIEPVHVNHDLLRMVRAWVPRWMESARPEITETFDKIVAQFDEWEKAHPKEYDGEVVDADFWREFNQSDLSALCDELCKLPLARMITGRADRGHMLRRCREIFFDIAFILSNQSWYERKRGAGALNSAYVGLPTHINSAVIMDATAYQSRAYDLLGSIPNFRPMPDNIRNYGNVRLHVVYGYQNSTYHLMKPGQDEQHFVDVVDAFDPAMPSNTKFLFVTSKEVSKKLTKLKSKYEKCEVAYWGDINGKNEWSDCTAIVIYGLPRLSEITPQISILAFENWHKKTKRNYIPPAIVETMPDDTDTIYNYDEFVEEEDYHQGHVTSEIIQAINRVQCRKITDDNGGCPETDVYLLFNTGDEFEQAILKAIDEEMSGIQIISSHAPSVQKKAVRSKLGQEIIKRLKVLPKEEYSVIDLVSKLHAETGNGSVAARKSFIGNCKNETSPEARALAAIGYIYHADPNGGRSKHGTFKRIDTE